MIKGESDYMDGLKKRYIVRARDEYIKLDVFDSQLGRKPEPGEEWEIDGQRLQILMGQNDRGVQYVDVVRTITDEEKPKNQKPQTKKKGVKKNAKK